MRHIYILFILFISIAILYTYPLAFNLSTMLPGIGESDTPLSVWNIWHFKKSIFSEHNLFAFRTNYIFYPQNPSLVLHNYAMTTGLMSIPLQCLFSPIVSRNILFFIQFVLTGLGMYFLVLRFTGNKIAALWSAVTLSFCPYVIIRSYNYFHFSTVWFFPWFIYALWKFLDTEKLKFSLLAALIYALCLINDQTYFVFLTILTVPIVIFFRLRAQKISPGPRLIKNSLIGCLFFLVLSFPYLRSLADEIVGSGNKLSVWPDLAIDYFSLDLNNILRPSPILSLYRKIPYICVPMQHVTNVFAGYIPLFFALYALLNIKNASHEKRTIITLWLTIGIVCFFIALGPLPFGKNSFLNIFSLYNLLCAGPLKQIRIPVRFSLISLIAIYIIAGFGVERFVTLNDKKRLNSVVLSFFLITMQVIEFLPMPYPLLNLEVPEVYRSLSSQNTDSPLLVLPLGWQSSYKTIGRYHKRIQYYQTIHGHPIFQGQIARIEDNYFDYYLSREGFRYLIEADDRLPTESEKIKVYAILRQYGIKDVVIHSSYFDKRHLEALLQMFKNYPGRLSVELAM